MHLIRDLIYLQENQRCQDCLKLHKVIHVNIRVAFGGFLEHIGSTMYSIVYYILASCAWINSVNKTDVHVVELAAA